MFINGRRPNPDLAYLCIPKNYDLFHQKYLLISAALRPKWPVALHDYNKHDRSMPWSLFPKSSDQIKIIIIFFDRYRSVRILWLPITKYKLQIFQNYIFKCLRKNLLGSVIITCVNWSRIFGLKFLEYFRQSHWYNCSKYHVLPHLTKGNLNPEISVEL